MRALAAGHWHEAAPYPLHPSVFHVIQPLSMCSAGLFIRLIVYPVSQKVW